MRGVTVGAALSLRPLPGASELKWRATSSTKLSCSMLPAAEKDHVAGLEALLEEADEGVLLETADGFAGAEDGLAERMALPEILHKDFVDERVGIVLVHLDFFEDDAALAGDFL